MQILYWLGIIFLIYTGGFFAWVGAIGVFLAFVLPSLLKNIKDVDISDKNSTDTTNQKKTFNSVNNDGSNFIEELRKEFANRDYSGLDILAANLAAASIHIAKVDGVISEEEISAIRFTITNEFSNNVDQEKIARIVSMTKLHLSNIGVNGIYESLLALINQYIGMLQNIDKAGQSDLVILLFTIMYEVAIADGGIHPSEERLFSRLCGYFSLSNEQLEIIIRTANYHYQYRKNEATKPDESLRFKDSIVFLGVSADYTKEDLEKAWRKIAILHHPDKFHNSNQALYDLATKKFQEAQDAFQYLKEFLDKPRPKIKVEKKANTQHSSVTSDIELRLQKLDNLRLKGLVSEEEYKKKREEILKDI